VEKEVNVRPAKNRSLPYLRASAMLALLLIPIVASAQAIPETPNILTNIMNNFLGVFSGGFVRLLPWAKTLMIILATIEIVWAALYWAMEGENFLPQLLQKIMVIGITGWLVLTWPALCKTVMDGFIGAGAMAGNGAGGAAVPDLRDPSQVLNVFWTLAQPIADYTSTLGIMDIGKIILVGFGYIILAVAIFIIAIQCALTYLEFYVVAVLATVLVPFGINKHMSFLAEKSFGAVISHGIKLAVLSFILTAAAPVLQNILTPGGANAITYNLIFNLDAAALLIAFLAWHGPSIAAGLFGGGPALHAGAVARAGGSGAFMLGRMLGSASGRGAGGTGSIGQVRKAAGAIGSGVGTAALALTGAGGAVAGAARGGAALAGVAGAGRAGQAAAGVVGVARMASGAAVNAGRSTATAAVSPVKRATSALKASWQSGQVAGAVGSGAASQWPRRG
jgi:type IV secretion system protein TrbL